MPRTIQLAASLPASPDRLFDTYLDAEEHAASPHWGAADLDSTLILTFVPESEGGRIELTHVNVVDNDFAGVSHGWERFYWTPWRAYLSRAGT